MISFVGLVLLYTMTGCSHCDQEKVWLNQHHIKYEERNISNPKYLEEAKSYGATGTPLLVFNGHAVEGYKPDSLDQLFK